MTKCETAIRVGKNNSVPQMCLTMPYKCVQFHEWLHSVCVTSQQSWFSTEILHHHLRCHVSKPTHAMKEYQQTTCLMVNHARHNNDDWNSINYTAVSNISAEWDDFCNPHQVPWPRLHFPPIYTGPILMILITFEAIATFYQWLGFTRLTSYSTISM